MSQASTKPVPPRRCLQCGAVLDETAKSCWLCAAQPPALAIEPASSNADRKPVPDINPWLTHGVIWLAIIVTAIVGYGVFVENMIIGLGYVIAVAPPILVTLTTSVVSRATGHPVHPAAKVALGAGVAVLSVSLAAVAIALAVIIGLFQLCTMGKSPLLDFLNR